MIENGVHVSVEVKRVNISPHEGNEVSVWDILVDAVVLTCIGIKCARTKLRFEASTRMQCPTHHETRLTHACFPSLPHFA
jgi:hypothetical protein